MGLVGLGVAPPYRITFWASTLNDGDAGTARRRRIRATFRVAPVLESVLPHPFGWPTASASPQSPTLTTHPGDRRSSRFMVRPLSPPTDFRAAGVPDDPAGVRRRLGADGAGRQSRRRGRLGNGTPTAWAGGALAFAVTSMMGALVWPVPGDLRFGIHSGSGRVGDRDAGRSLYRPAFGGSALGMALYFASMGRPHARALLGALSRHRARRRRGWVLANVLGMGIDVNFSALPGITAYGLITASFVRRGVWGT